ncbi:hypothetical protein GCM10011529_04960 [Polymorphobacter glacialis]|uniref:MerC domain-containing protein n=1 Tax=Sandarakinorhabdus glacialis TaxID=1614636 RepID=A0A917E4X0_9SPHN|nr:MerC domain-containing protein [Polymorphobacter glacialis]GGE01619.1 hypothetical protein GCM10011529_04960 [Polymorphobacter glacialis]
MPKRFSSLLDKSAMTLSGLCIVHCLGGTLLATIFAASSGWLGHDVHLIGLALALPLAGFALWRGVLVHGQAGVAVLGALGIGLMAISVFAGHGGSTEIMLSVAGVSLLGGAHLWNLRAARG